MDEDYIPLFQTQKPKAKRKTKRVYVKKKHAGYWRYASDHHVVSVADCKAVLSGRTCKNLPSDLALREIRRLGLSGDESCSRKTLFRKILKHLEENDVEFVSLEEVPYEGPPVKRRVWVPASD